MDECCTKFNYYPSGKCSMFKTSSDSIVESFGKKEKWLLDLVTMFGEFTFDIEFDIAHPRTISEVIEELRLESGYINYIKTTDGIFVNLENMEIISYKTRKEQC